MYGPGSYVFVMWFNILVMVLDDCECVQNLYSSVFHVYSACMYICNYVCEYVVVFALIALLLVVV